MEKWRCGREKYSLGWSGSGREYGKVKKS